MNAIKEVVSGVIRTFCLFLTLATAWTIPWLCLLVTKPVYARVRACLASEGTLTWIVAGASALLVLGLIKRAALSLIVATECILPVLAVAVPFLAHWRGWIDSAHALPWIAGGVVSSLVFLPILAWSGYAFVASIQKHVRKGEYSPPRLDRIGMSLHHVATALGCICIIYCWWPDGRQLAGDWFSHSTALAVLLLVTFVSSKLAMECDRNSTRGDDSEALGGLSESFPSASCISLVIYHCFRSMCSFESFFAYLGCFLIVLVVVAIWMFVHGFWIKLVLEWLDYLGECTGDAVLQYKYERAKNAVRSCRRKYEHHVRKHVKKEDLREKFLKDVEQFRQGINLRFAARCCMRMIPRSSVKETTIEKKLKDFEERLKWPEVTESRLNESALDEMIQESKEMSAVEKFWLIVLDVAFNIRGAPGMAKLTLLPSGEAHLDWKGLRETFGTWQDLLLALDGKLTTPG